MKKYLGLSIIFIIVVALGFVIIDPLEMRNNLNDETMVSPKPTAKITPQPSPSFNPSPMNEPVPEELPEGWSWSYDPSLEIQLAYPANWTLQSATSSMGESAVYSFDPTTTPDVGGIPADELKIAVNYFAPEDSRSPSINQNEIISQEKVNIDGYSGVRYELEGEMSGSFTTRIETTQGVYLIVALPGDSDLIDQYQTFLNYLQLQEPSPVTLDDFEINSVIGLPLTVSGTAPGNWLSEGQLPVRLQTYDGKLLVETTAITTEDWMTTEPVNFSVELSDTQNLSQLESIYGLLVFEKSNPSGLPENANQVMFPVRFEEQE